MNKFGKIFYGTFFSLFIVVGLAVTIFGLVRLAKYYCADEVEATVISSEYHGGYDVVFSFEHGGKYFEKSVHYDKVTQDGYLPFYHGKQIVIRVDGSDNIVDFDRSDIIFTSTGVIFAVAGSLFLYFFVLRKQNAFDIANEYESAMIKPEDAEDDTQKYEAVADQLTKLGSKSPERMIGEAGVWFNRMKDRYKTYTVWENILIGLLFIGPIILLSFYPPVYGITFDFGRLIVVTIAWIFVCAIVGLLFKALYNIYLQILIKAGRFSVKKLATVQCCAFESEAYFQTGEFSRTHTIFRKFKVVALIDGKRSVGYVKGNVPPPKGAVLKVLVRPRLLNKWIIDKDA